jgi:hypothetical protein
MRRFWPFALVALAGLCLGIASDEVRHVVRDRSRAEVFQQRLRCRSLVDAYAKENSDEYSSLIVDRVDFSRARNSCIAAISTAMSGKRGTIWGYETIDLVTGEKLFSGSCAESGANVNPPCDSGRNIELMRKRDKTMEIALSSKE